MKPINEAIPEIQTKLASTPPTPVGTFAFVIYGKDLFDPGKPGGIIFEGALGAHVFRIEREVLPRLVYYHWSPGIGSRMATIDLTQTSPSDKTQICMTWSPSSTQLTVIPVGVPHVVHLIAEGQPCNRSFRVTKDRRIVQIGDLDARILDPWLYCGDNLVLEPTAIEGWNGITEATKVLLGGTSADGYLFDVVVSNAILTALVTGFETYCKRRLVEIEGEGVTPDLKKLAAIVSRNKESAVEFLEQNQSDAAQANMSVIEFWTAGKRSINLQDFEQAKEVFKAAYGLRFGDIGIKGDRIARLRKLFQYRHRIVHVSPLLTPLENDGDDGNPVFPSKTLASAAADLFSAFIGSLHAATLKLGTS